jgi:hypothetical protein
MLHLIHAVYLVIHMIPTVNSLHFSTSINRLIFVKEIYCVSCEVQTQFFKYCLDE